MEPTPPTASPTATATPSALVAAPCTFCQASSGSFALSHNAPATSSAAAGFGHRPPGLRRRQLRLRPGVEQHLADVDVVHAVHQGQVGLGHDGEPVTLQTLDHVHLPQRPRAIQPPGHHPTDELPQLLHRAGSWQGGAPDVEGQVEALVVHPDRRGEPGRDVADTLPIARDVGDPLPDQRDQPLVVQAVGLGVEDVDRRDVRRRVRGVQHEQGHLQRRQSLRHRHSPPSRASPVP